MLLAAAIHAFFTLGHYSWTPASVPDNELFSTRARGTAIALVFDAPRFIAFLGPKIIAALPYSTNCTIRVPRKK